MCSAQLAAGLQQLQLFAQAHSQSTQCVHAFSRLPADSLVCSLPVAEIAASSKKCGECSARLLDVDFHRQHTPLLGGDTHYSGCLFCDRLLSSLTDSALGAVTKRQARKVQAAAERQQRDKGERKGGGGGGDRDRRGPRKERS